MLRSTSLNAYMCRSTCLGFYAMFSYVLFLSLLYVDVKVTYSHACTMLLATRLCVFCRVSCLDLYPYMSMCLDLCSTMSMC